MLEAKDDSVDTAAAVKGEVEDKVVVASGNTFVTDAATGDTRGGIHTAADAAESVEDNATAGVHHNDYWAGAVVPLNPSPHESLVAVLK